eukprot:11998077-Prorocentrum_lima.AAC.1
MSSFLRLLFSHSVATSTYVERMLSKLTDWTRRRQGLSLVAAKSVLSAFGASVRRWRESFKE